MNQRTSTLETARLVLRPMQSDDQSSMHRIANEPGVRRYMFDGLPVAIESIHKTLAESAANFTQRGFGIWMIREKGQEVAIGFVGLRAADEVDEVEILYALSDSKPGRGYATEVATAVCRYAFEQTGLKCLVGMTDPPNTASWRVLEKLGMREYHPPGAPGHLRYAIVARADFLAL